MDGPYCNKPDEGQTLQGNVAYIWNYNSLTNAGFEPTTFFSPNREVSSPVMFGSLPIGLDHPWRTLLFVQLPCRVTRKLWERRTTLTPEVRRPP